jgi:hypothetical protein
MSRTLREIVTDELSADRDFRPNGLQATVEAIENTTDAEIICRGCGSLADPPHVTVLVYPRPWADDEEGNPLTCHDCWASEAAQKTDLTERQARILALRAAGYTQGDIGKVMGFAGSNASATLSKLRNRKNGIQDKITELERTEDVLGIAFDS